MRVRDHWLPIYGYPAGYGLMHNDPATIDDIWSWVAALTDWKHLSDAFKGTTDTFWDKQIKDWNTYNAAFPNSPAPPPANQAESSNCTFVFSPTRTSPDTTGGVFWVGDANWMKSFAGGVRYISFANGAWAFNKINVLGGVPHNQVQEFCQCNPANAIGICSSN